MPGSSSVLAAAAVGGENPQARPACSAATVCRQPHAGDDRQVEEAARAGPDALAVVDVDGGVGEDHRVRARRVGGAQHGARVARVPDVGEQRDQDRPRRGDLVKRHVDEVADREQALRGDRLGELAHHLAADQLDVDAGVLRPRDQVGVPRLRGRGDEEAA